jgi:hypothetical protein
MGRTYAKLPAAELDYQIMEPGDALAVGERVWLSSASAGSLGRRARVRYRILCKMPKLRFRAQAYQIVSSPGWPFGVQWRWVFSRSSPATPSLPAGVCELWYAVGSGWYPSKVRDTPTKVPSNAVVVGAGACAATGVAHAKAAIIESTIVRSDMLSSLATSEV